MKLSYLNRTSAKISEFESIDMNFVLLQTVDEQSLNAFMLG